MGKFKVGDKVRVLDASKISYSKDCYTTGMETEVIEVHNGYIFLVGINGETGISINPDELHAIELIEPKITKNQRIAKLENEVAELKLIVHQLREPNKEIVAAKLKFESKTIEFEGAKYRKVNREARDGDVVIVVGDAEETEEILKNKHYKVNIDIKIKGMSKSYPYKVYNPEYNRTPETVEVYELIAYEIPAIEPPAHPHPKTANQLRAEIIEKAKVFLIGNKVKRKVSGKLEEVYVEPRNSKWCRENFIVNKNKKTVVCILKTTFSENIESKGIAKCMPNDVFNEHIGKVIALGRALKLDVSEFEQAVQPDEIEIGMKVFNINDEIVGVKKESDIGNFSLNYARTTKRKIHDDTNVIYDEVN